MFGLWSLASGCIPRPRSCQRFSVRQGKHVISRDLISNHCTRRNHMSYRVIQLQVTSHTRSRRYQVPKMTTCLGARRISGPMWCTVFSFAFLLNLCHSCHVDRWQGLAASILRRHSRRHPVSWKSISRRIHSELIGRPRSACTSDLECSDLIRSQQLVWGHAAWCRHCKIMSLFDLLRLEQSYIQGKGEGQIRIPCWSCCREWTAGLASAMLLKRRN